MAIAYVYDGCLYLAVTRRCTLHCTFCPKTHGRWVVAGNDLHADAEPTSDELLAAVEALEGKGARHHEVAFVGLGEPTLRLPVVLAVGRALRAKGYYVRLVTDGLASLREGRDVTPELEGAVHEVDVSLNAPDGDTYAGLCPNPYGARAHAAACAFVRGARRYVPHVCTTFVAVPGLDVGACERLAASLGAHVRIRPFFDPLVGEPHPGAPLPRPSARPQA